MVLDGETGEPMRAEEVWGQWVVPVDLIGASLDRAYFTAAVKACEAKLGIWRAMRR